MIIYPAIDLRHGKCIRLYQGDYTRETVYALNPYEVIETFIEHGAHWLHIIDLDAAKDPQQHQRLLLEQLIKLCPINIQIGGGIRSKHQVEHLLSHGARRVIIGSLAISHPTEVADWFACFGAEQLVLALDIIYSDNAQPMVVENGWQNVSQYSLFELIEYFQPAGVKHILCTNVSLDGTLHGPDYPLYEALIARFPSIHLQASGGIRALSDIRLLAQIRVQGAIIGRALYENKFTLREGLSC